MIRNRWLAATAGPAVLVGVLVMLAALVGTPGSWLTGYVSEAGTSGQPYAGAYRCGLVLLALGVALLGSTLRRLRPVGALLLGAAVLAGVSAVVPCSRGCPLPPFASPTTADVVHAAASIVGMVTLATAMVLVALTPALGCAARRLAVCAVALVVPLGGCLGLTMLFIGRGPLNAALERLLLVIAVSWLIGTCLLTAGPPRAPAAACTTSSPAHALPPTRAWARPHRGSSADPPDDRQQRFRDVLDGALRLEDQPVNGHDQADAEKR
jgi:hypothetical protein